MQLGRYIIILASLFSLTHAISLFAEHSTSFGRGIDSTGFGGGFGGGFGNGFGGGFGNGFGNGFGGGFGGNGFGGGGFGGGGFGGGGLGGGGGVQNDGHSRKAAEEINKLGEKAIENINKLGEEATKNYDKLSQGFGSAVDKIVSQPDGVKDSLAEVNKNLENLAEQSKANSDPVGAGTVDQIVEGIKNREKTKEKQLEEIRQTLSPPNVEPKQKFESVGNALAGITGSGRIGNPLAEAIGAKDPKGDSVNASGTGPNLESGGSAGRHGGGSVGFMKQGDTYNPPVRKKPL